MGEDLVCFVWSDVSFQRIEASEFNANIKQIKLRIKPYISKVQHVENRAFKVHCRDYYGQFYSFPIIKVDLLFPQF